MWTQWVVAPLVGGVIGYITNDIAIKMLFHPRKSYYIGRFHIPFTPGLIPQQKGRIAISIGRVISGNLLNADTLRATVLSDQTVETLRVKLLEGIESLAEDPRSLRDLLLQRFSAEQLESMEKKACELAAEFALERLIQAHVGEIITKALEAEIDKALRSISTGLSEAVSRRAGAVIEKVVDKQLQERGPELFGSLAERLAGELLDARLCEIYSAQKENIPQLVDGAAAVYKEVLGSNLEKLLEAVNIEKVIVDKIRAFDAVQLEEMIFGILKRELKAIVYLGAALGFLMGFINVLI